MTVPDPPIPQPNSQALPPDTVVGEFTIKRVLGSGVSGITYLATDRRLERQVVVKENLPVPFAYRDTQSLTVLPRHTEGVEAESFAWSLKNFEKGAAMRASLDHPGIVSVLRCFEAFGTTFFVMPFVAGTAIDEQIKGRQERGIPFSEEALRAALLRILEALEYLHARGIYHGDIKPGNILITESGEPVLIDFGSARQRLSERSLALIESPGYTPFEQLQSRGKIGPRSDQYALACTFYKVITGETPPKATDRLTDDPIEPLAGRGSFGARYSHRFLASIDRAMSPKSDARFADSREWRESVWDGAEESEEKPSNPHPESAVVNVSAVEEQDAQSDVLEVPVPSPSLQGRSPGRRRGSPRKKSVLGMVIGAAAVAVAVAVVAVMLALVAFVSGVTRSPEPPVEWDLKSASEEAIDRYAEAGNMDALVERGSRLLFLDQGGANISREELAAAIDDLRNAAEKGHPRGMAGLGVCYSNGTGLEKDEKEAASWYRKAAELGDTEAMFNLSMCYASGTGVEKDERKVARWYRKAADLENARAMASLGLCYANGTGVEKDEQEAVNWYRKAAEAGDPSGMNSLGACLGNGIGVTQDEAEAVNWYRKAAEAGNPPGMNSLGVCLRNGIGVTQDESEALRWYRKATELGNPGAMFNLGTCYAYGTGVVQDEAEAVRWYRKAAEAGETAAMYNLGLCCANGTGLEQDEVEAVRWYRKAAELEVPMAMNGLGVCLEHGIGITQDEPEAVSWYRKAAEAGNEAAMFNLGNALRNGIGVEPDAAEGVRWFRKVAELEDSEAMFNLGVCYASGTGVRQDEAVAVDWYRKAAELEYPSAMFNLGVCYANGTGLEKDEIQAVSWYLRAAELGDTEAMVNLGNCYASGTGVIKGDIKAVSWYRRAAESEDPRAMYNLGVCYNGGLGVEKNDSETVRWLRKAAEWEHPNAMYYLGLRFWSGLGVEKNEQIGAVWLRKAAEAGVSLSLGEKLQAFTVTSVNFHQVPLGDALEYIRLKALELDPDTKGIPFVVEEFPPAMLRDLKITIERTNISLNALLDHVVWMGKANYEVEETRVVIRPGR